MSNNPAKYEVLIKQYLHSILDIIELLTNGIYKTTLIIGKGHQTCSALCIANLCFYLVPLLTHTQEPLSSAPKVTVVETFK